MLNVLRSSPVLLQFMRSEPQFDECVRSKVSAVSAVVRARTLPLTKLSPHCEKEATMQAHSKELVRGTNWQT